MFKQNIGVRSTREKALPLFEKFIQNLLTSHSRIFRIFQHFATKLSDFLILGCSSRLCILEPMNLLNSAFSLMGEWSIDSNSSELLALLLKTTLYLIFMSVCMPLSMPV